MKILILSCNTGEGHNSCPRAISEELERKGDWGYIAEGLAFLSTGTSKFVSGWHTRLYRYFPRLYGKGYEYAEKHPMNIKKHTAAYRMIRRGAKRLRKVIKAGGYDGVICTHLFPAMMVTGLVKKGTVTIPACFVATDYTASPGCEKVSLPTITPHPDLTGEFQAVGIPAENILAYGIPVRSMFTEKTDKAEAKRKAGLDPERLHMVIMGGSMGCGPMEDVLAEIAAGMPENIELTVICGTNKQTAEKLRRRHGENPRVHIRGYVKDMSLMLDSADLYLTKAGGISTTEAAIKGVPLVLDGDLTLLIQKGDEQGVQLVPDLPEAVEAPIAAGQEVGGVQVVVDGRAVARIPVVAEREVTAKGLKNALQRVVGLWGL